MRHSWLLLVLLLVVGTFACTKESVRTADSAPRFSLAPPPTPTVLGYRIGYTLQELDSPTDVNTVVVRWKTNPAARECKAKGEFSFENGSHVEVPAFSGGSTGEEMVTLFATKEDRGEGFPLLRLSIQCFYDDGRMLGETLEYPLGQNKGEEPQPNVLRFSFFAYEERKVFLCNGQGP